MKGAASSAASPATGPIGPSILATEANRTMASAAQLIKARDKSPASAPKQEAAVKGTPSISPSIAYAVKRKKVGGGGGGGGGCSGGTDGGRGGVSGSSGSTGGGCRGVDGLRNKTSKLVANAGGTQSASTLPGVTCAEDVPAFSNGRESVAAEGIAVTPARAKVASVTIGGSKKDGSDGASSKKEAGQERSRGAIAENGPLARVSGSGGGSGGGGTDAPPEVAVSHEGSGGGGSSGAITDSQRERQRNVYFADKRAKALPTYSVSPGAESSSCSDGAVVAAERARGSVGGQAAVGSEPPRRQWKESRRRGRGKRGGRKGRGEAEHTPEEVSWLG